MSNLRWTSVLVGIIFLLSSPAQAAGPTVKVTQVDPTGFPEITIYVSVTDERGELIGDLTKDDFQLFEDGKPVDVKDFAGLGEVRTVDIAFVFDTTGSMREEIEGVKNTSIAFANKLRDKNRDFRLGLVAFGDEIREVRKNDGSLTADAEEFKGWIGRLRAEGGDDNPEISLDGVKRATQMTYRAGTQKVLILITDAPPHEKGDGTRFSQVVPEELVQQVRDQGFTVYAVAYDHKHFRRLVNETGGEFYKIRSEADFTGIIDKIGGLIANQYRLTYHSARPSYDGTRRAVEVEVGGVKAEGTYLEEHLINIRSDGIIALAFLLPLLLALALPTAADRIRRPAPQLEPGSAGAGEPGSQPDQAIPPGPAVPQLPDTAVTSQVACPNCGHALRPEARFCGRCGQAMVAQATEPQPAACPHCGRSVRPGASFCGGCGQKL